MLLLKVKLEPSNICANQELKIYTCSAHYDNAERFKPITINLWLGSLDASDRIKPTHLHRCLFQNSTLDWNPSSIAVYRKCATYKRSVRSAHYSNAERWARSRNLNMRDFSFQHRETGDAWKRKKRKWDFFVHVHLQFRTKKYKWVHFKVWVRKNQTHSKIDH